MMVWWWFEVDYNFWWHIYTYTNTCIYNTNTHICVYAFLCEIIYPLNIGRCSILCNFAGESLFKPLDCVKRGIWGRNPNTWNLYSPHWVNSHKSRTGEWKKYINPRIGKYFFLLGEIFTTHFLCQTLSEQMGRGVPSDLVGIWKIILWFLALESKCILMAS